MWTVPRGQVSCSIIDTGVALTTRNSAPFGYILIVQAALSEMPAPTFLYLFKDLTLNKTLKLF